MGVQQLEDICSNVRVNLRARSNILCLGTNDLNEERCKSGDNCRLQNFMLNFFPYLCYLFHDFFQSFTTETT
jgi:hypothetical protein